MNRYLFSCLLSLILFLMTSCASMNSYTEKRAMCTTLKSEIVFSGATSDIRQAEIQTSEEPLEQYTYDRANCDARWSLLTPIPLPGP